MAKLLSSYGDVRNESRCLSELKTQVKELSSLTDENVIKRVNESVDKTGKVRYFDYSYTELDERESGKDVMWLDSGFVNTKGDTIYIQFTGSGLWQGALVGTEESILEYQKLYWERLSSKDNTNSREKLEQELGVDLNSISGVNVVFDSDDDGKTVTQKVNKNEAFLKMLYDRLLIPHSWTIKHLDNYINMCISRLNNLIKNGKDCNDYIIFNESQSLALINSGLLDRFGKYIMLVTQIYNRTYDGSPIELGYTGLRLGNSKVSLCEDGFTKDDLNKVLERVSFTDNGLSDLVFDGDLDDFDLDSRSRLEHCITERKFRFPDSYAEASEEVICADITKAIELAVELNKYDRNYIKPIYNRKRDNIDFVIPYHVGNDFQKKPELGIVIAFFSGYWQIMTVLDYEDVMRDIKLFNMYENETF